MVFFGWNSSSLYDPHKHKIEIIGFSFHALLTVYHLFQNTWILFLFFFINILYLYIFVIFTMVIISISTAFLPYYRSYRINFINEHIDFSTHFEYMVHVSKSILELKLVSYFSLPVKISQTQYWLETAIMINSLENRL